jgi:outer membrane protein OmpA-like peptidoglycan-associated protein
MFDELSDKAIKQGFKNENSWEHTRKAAICHFYLFEIQKSCDRFKVLETHGKLTKSDLEYYFKAMRALGKYAESISLIEGRKEIVQQSAYLSAMLTHATENMSLFKDSSRIKLYDPGLNSGKGDFAASYFGKDLYYVSKSKNARNFKSLYAWDLDYFTNIHKATPTSDSTFLPGTLEKDQLLSKAHDGPVSFNAAGTKMLITRNLPVGKGSKVTKLVIYFSELSNGIWTEPVLMSINLEGYNSGHAVFFGNNDQLIYFASDRPGGKGKSDIWFSKFENNTWSTPENVAGINTTENELFPYLLDNTLYFASEGYLGLGGLDIYLYDPSVNSLPVNIGYPLNTRFDDFGLITQDGITGYLSSNREDYIDRIYYFRKRPITIKLEGFVYVQYKEKEALASQIVVLTEIKTAHTDTLTSNELGKFSCFLRSDGTYKLSTSKEDFILISEANVETNDLNTDTTLYCELGLNPTTIQIRLRVTEARTGNIITGALTSIADYNMNGGSPILTDELGMATFKVDRNKSYWAYASKKGYKDDSQPFNSENTNDKVIDLELKLPPIVKGDRFKLENIFYDLNKSTLRPESKFALDKLADFIIKNDLKIELSAHTDARGSDAYNLKLSQARAQSCVDYLITKGVKKSSITARGYGETKLMNKCKNNINCPEELHQENRRTEVKIL